MPVFEHALQWLRENESYQPDFVVQLRPTSPIRPVGLLDEAVRKLLEHPEADCVRGVVPSGQNPFKMWQIGGNGKLEPLLNLPNMKEPYNAPRQELPKTYWQTGHVDVIRTSTILEKGSLTGDIILPILIDPRYTVDIDTPSDMVRYARLMQDPELKPIDPLKSRRQFPTHPKLLVMDFDGVFTDDTVITDQDGRESVLCSRSDGFGLDMLRQHSKVHAIILSREENPVVSARALKLKLEVYQGVQDKAQAIQQLIKNHNLAQAEVIYIGNDLNDLVVLPLVGYFVCPSDAHPQVLRQADLVLNHPGGRGAIRELIEIILRSEHES